MSAIWLLSTRGRPAECQRVLDACEATGMTSQGLVYVDETVEMYQDIRLPANWEIHLEPEWGSIAAAMHYTQKHYPGATQYGWLADDNIPKTQGWDKALEEAAEDWNVAIARDFWLSETGWTHPTGGPCFTAGLCWGAKVIDAVGWWVLPGVRQGGIDGAWNDLAGMCGLTRYLHEVEVEHLCWQLEKREKDDNDNWVKHGQAYIDADLVVYYDWVKRRRRHDAVRIRTAMRRASRPDRPGHIRGKRVRRR